MAEFKEGASGTGMFSGAGGARVLNEFAEKIGGSFGAKAKEVFLNEPTSANNSSISNTGLSSDMIQSPVGSDGVLGTQGIQPYASDYTAQGITQSMNVNPMLNNSIGSLGQNSTGGIGLSSGLGNIPMAQKYNGLGNIGHNPQGNNYNIIGGVKLV